MKPKFFVLALAACLQVCIAQTQLANLNITASLSLCGEGAADTYLASGAPTTNYGSHPSMGGNTWTCQGSLCLSRALFRFDLSSIPPNAIISQAYLELYADVSWSPSATTGGPSNSGTVSRVTAPWSEFGVTWVTQPPTSNLNTVAIPGSTMAAQNYTLDVTQLVKDMLVYGNNGFMLKMDDENNYYKSLMFASSDNSDPAKCPQLLVGYTNSLVTGVASEMEEEVYLHVFPGMFGQELTIKSNTAMSKISITDALGKVCWNEQLNAKVHTLKPALAAGIYYVTVYNSEEKYIGVKRVIKTE